VAAMNNRQKTMGHNAAKELLHNLGLDAGDSLDSLQIRLE